MFWSQNTSSAPHEIYSSSFAPIHHGYALWLPEPQKHGEPQIGDVGFFVDGGFHRLFSLDTRDPSKRVTTRPIPFDPTEPLPLELLETHTTSRRLVAKAHCTYGVKATETSGHVDVGVGGGSAGVGARYACVAAQGAVLDLQSAADSEVLYRNTLLKEYILRNHARWVAYARETLHLDIPAEDIVFVSGAIKARADWAVMAFSNTLKSHRGSIGGHVAGLAGFAVSRSHTFSVAGAEMERYGGRYTQGAGRGSLAEAKQNQSIFLERYRVKKWLGVLKTMSAGAGSHGPPDWKGRPDRHGTPAEDGAASNTSDAIEHIVKNGDRVEMLLEYIFEVAGVGVAIASDGDVKGILGFDTVVDFSSYLRRKQPPVRIDGEVGCIAMEHVVDHEYKRRLSSRRITETLLFDWPKATLKDAGRLGDVEVHAGSASSPSHPVKLPYMVFTDPKIPPSRCSCMAISPDGLYLAASFWSFHILVWRIRDGLCLQHLQDRCRFVHSLAFSPDSRTLVSGSEKNTPIIWDMRTGRIVQHLEGHRVGEIRNVIYAPFGDLIATASNGEHIARIWDANSGACLHSYSTYGSIHRMLLSQSADRLHVKTGDRLLTYDLTSYALTSTLQSSNHGTIDCVYSQGGDVVATHSATDPYTIHSPGTTSTPRRVQLSTPLSLCAALSPDGTEFIAVGSGPGQKKALSFDAETGKPCRTYELSAHAEKIAYTPDSTLIAVVLSGDTVDIFDRSSAIRIVRLNPGAGVGLDGEITFLPDSSALVMPDRSGRIHVLNIQDALRLQ